MIYPAAGNVYTPSTQDALTAEQEAAAYVVYTTPTDEDGICLACIQYPGSVLVTYARVYSADLPKIRYVLYLSNRYVLFRKMHDS